MDRAAILQITADRDRQPFEVALLLAQDIEIAQRLGRMLAAAVAGVEDRTRRVFGGDPCGAVVRMAHDDQVGVGADHAGRVGEAFALGRGAGVHIGRTDHGAAEAMHRGLETEAGASRGFVKQRGHDQAARKVEALATLQCRRKLIRQREDPFDFRDRQVLDRDHVAFRQPRHQVLLPPITTASRPSTSLSRTWIRSPFGACRFLPT